MDINKHLRLYQKMKTAIAETMPERIGEFDKEIQNYSGSPRVLEDVMNHFGNDNPYLAMDNAVLKQAIFRTTKELKEEMSEGKKPVHGISASGHELTNQMFVVAHKYDPTVVMNFGSQAITKVMETFGTEEQTKAFTTEGRERIKKERKEEKQNYMDDFAPNLEDLLQNPEKIKDVNSRQARIKLHSILNLDEEVKKRLLMIDKLKYGETAFVDSQDNAYMLASEKPGTFFGWFKRNQEKLPKIIRDMYTTLENSLVELTKEERKEILGSLIAYFATKIPINRESAIGGYQKDLDFIMQLEDDNSIIEQYGKPDLTRIRDVLSKPEITLIEATKVFNEYPIDEVRLEVNKAHSKQFKKETEKIVSDLEILFIENKKWLEDSYGISVPMGRLKETMQGIGLNRDDFAAVRDLLRIKTISVDEERSYKSLTLQNFKSLTDNIVVSKRKTDYMDNFFDEKGINPNDNLEEARKFKDNMLREKHYNIVENFELANDITIDELIKRAKSEFKFGEEYGQWSKVEEEMDSLVNVKLYSEKAVSEITDLIEETKQMVPYEQVEKEVETAKEIHKHKLLNKNWGINLPFGNKDYVRKVEMENVNNLLKAGKKIDELVESYAGNVDELIEKREKIKKGNFYSGNLKDSIRINEDSYSYLKEPMIDIDEKRKLRVIDINTLEEHLSDFSNQYMHFSELTDKWIEKANYIVSWDAVNAVAKQGLVSADRATYGKINHLDENSYVHKDLVKTMNEVYEQIENSAVVSDTVKGHEIANQAELQDKITLKIYNTKFAEKDRFKQEFRGFNWNKEDKCWETTKSKGAIASLTEKTEQYNQEYKSNLKTKISI